MIASVHGDPARGPPQSPAHKSHLRLTAMSPGPACVCCFAERHHHLQQTIALLTEQRLNSSVIVGAVPNERVIRCEIV